MSKEKTKVHLVISLGSGESCYNFIICKSLVTKLWDMIKFPIEVHEQCWISCFWICRGLWRNLQMRGITSHAPHQQLLLYLPQTQGLPNSPCHPPTQRVGVHPTKKSLTYQHPTIFISLHESNALWPLANPTYITRASSWVSGITCCNRHQIEWEQRLTLSNTARLIYETRRKPCGCYD